MGTRDLPITLYPDKAKVLILLAISVAFVLGSLLMIHDEPWVALGCGLFFGLGVVIFLSQLVPGCSYLKISEVGIEMRTLFKTTMLNWSDIEEFGVYRQRVHGLPLSKRIGLNFAPTYAKASSLRVVSKSLTGFEGGLPDTYGVGADALAQFLNQCLANYRVQTQTSETTSA